MSHLLYELPRPAVIAHRGASAYAPENTLAAFQLAVEQGADGIELDVRLSADEELIVIHNPTIEHPSFGKRRVAELTLAGLQAWPANSSPTPAGHEERIPTLDEVFACLGKKILINVELKPLGRFTKKLAEKVALLIQHHALQDYILCSSFSLPALQAIETHLPVLPRGLLLPPGYLLSGLVRLAGGRVNYQTLHPYLRDVSPQFLKAAKQSEHPVFAYTVNRDEEMKNLFALGIDGIFTDDPPLAQRIRASLFA